jgi:predicted PurR-regulated permease PerM
VKPTTMHSMQRQRSTIIFLATGTTLALALCLYIIAPYLRPIVAAALFAVIFHPLHQRVARVFTRFGRNTSAAALLSTILVLLIVTLPPLLLSVALQRELADLYRALQAQSASDGGIWPWLTRQMERATHWSRQFITLADFDLRALALERLQQWSNALLTRAAQFVGNLTSFVVELVVAFFTLFFLLRDGAERVRWLLAHAPLRATQLEQLSSGIYRTIIASVYGSLAVALAQGTLLALAFWTLGLPSPLLWGVVTGLFSLVPLVGSAAIWLPAALVLIFTGHWIKGLLLLGWGAGVVGLADNVIRPLVIHEQVQFRTIYVFFALLGGVQAFGLLGLIIGPVVLAVTQTLIKLLWEESRTTESTQAG